MKNLQLIGDEIDRYVSEISKKEEYKDKEYSYITDIQRFDKFLQQFGIDISTLEKVTINEAKKIYRDYLYKRRIEIIKHYLGLSGETTFLAMTERLENEKIREIIKAIKEGSFVVTPEMLGLKKKSLLRRFFESIGNKKTLLNPSREELTERLQKPNKNSGFVPKVEPFPVQTQILLEDGISPKLPEDKEPK